MSPLTFWRFLSCALMASLLATFAVLSMHIGYPAAWNNVQIGMKISEARSICGPATQPGGMHPERWEAPSLLGKWVLSVEHSEETQGSAALISTVDLFYEVALLKRIVVHHAVDTPIQDYKEFYRAYGQEWKATPYELSQGRRPASRP